MAMNPQSLRDGLSVLGLFALIVLLVAAAVEDWRHRRIPNRLCLSIALLAAPYGLASGWAVPADVMAHLVTAFALGAILFGAFCFGYLGGGDVKLMAALGLWLAPRAAVDALLVMAVAGGMLALVMAWIYRRRLSPPSVPYGVAVAVAGVSQVLPPLAHLLP